MYQAAECALCHDPFCLHALTACLHSSYVVVRVVAVLQMYSAAFDNLLGYVSETPEPFSSAPPEPNSWHANVGSAGSCCSVS